MFKRSVQNPIGNTNNVSRAYVGGAVRPHRETGGYTPQLSALTMLTCFVCSD